PSRVTAAVVSDVAVYVNGVVAAPAVGVVMPRSSGHRCGSSRHQRRVALSSAGPDDTLSEVNVRAPAGRDLPVQPDTAGDLRVGLLPGELGGFLVCSLRFRC